MSEKKQVARSPIVLMYHGIPTGSPEDRYALRADHFLRHLDYLQKTGWHTLTMEDLVKGERIPERSVVLTFDDAYEDNFENAFQPLLERGMVATWFVVASELGGTAVWLDGKGKQRRLMSGEQIREMRNRGMEIGSHGYRHVRYSRLDPAQQLEEMATSKRILEELLEEDVKGFAFPYGDYDDSALLALGQAGYSYACTTRSGRFNPDEDLFRVRRVAIYAGDSERILARKLVFADNDVSWKKLGRYYLRRIGARMPRLTKQ